MSLHPRTRVLTLGVATLAILLSSCQTAPEESPDVASLASDGETEIAENVPVSTDPREQAFDTRLEVEDQKSDGSSVTVAEATITAMRGFLVVHEDSNGAPGDVLGYTQIPAAAGTTGIEVELDEPLDPAGGVREVLLWAMLHADGEPVGEFQFPGPDGPLTRNDEPIMAPFSVTVTGDTAVSDDATGSG